MNQTNDQPRNMHHIPSPSELMRTMHPDLFSDTRASEAPLLPRAVFEYHLETLTSRKQEYEFEHFCRKLAEKEICPNLRVQTGPTGGGDSKVDTETYPVAAEIAERWWVGDANAGAERWAFAFSAKKAWKAKIKTDIANILSTGRDYKRIYFFSNQFISDKERSKQEDGLAKQAGIPVHIVDRAWIVEKVYENGHLDLAASTLAIEGAGSESLRAPGPRDAARLAELEELDRQITDQNRYHCARYQLVEDCLRGAILARSLERSRDEVENRFAQAERIAQQLGFRQQQMRVAYNLAWTAHWWYNDFPSFNRFYDEVERYLEDSSQAGEVERLLNLWQLLPPAVAAGRLSAQDAKVEDRRARLEAMLLAIAADSARPNNALEARTSLALIKAAQAYRDGAGGQRDAVWDEFSQIVDASTGLGIYPIERLSDLLQVIGKHVDSAAFDALYEKVVDVVRQRRSEGEAGKAYSTRGTQKLQQDKPYEAIQWFGRAEELLIKQEYRAELVLALAGSSCAYERVGLIWAARNKILVAVERSTAVLLQEGEFILPALRALQQLVWTELQLGRIPHVLNVMTMAAVVAAHLKLSEERQAAHQDEVMMQEAVLGIHLLNIPYGDLPSVSRLPDVLERLGLTNARLPLLYALGQVQAIYDEHYFPADENEDKLQSFFERWHDQPAAKDISAYPVLVDGSTSFLRSTILGSKIVLETPSNPVSFGVAESLLGALEAFAATSDEGDLLPHRELTTIVIQASNHVVGIPEIHFSDDGITRIEILHPVDLRFSGPEDFHNFSNWLQEAIITLLARIFVIRDIQTWLDKIAGQERAFSRALILGDALTLDRNIFGEQFKFQLADWIDDNDKVYERLRPRPWRDTKVADTVAFPDSGHPLKFGSGPPPPDLVDTSRLKHTDRHIGSPIDIELWDRAKWCGTLFAEAEGTPPILGIMFENGQAGQAIFSAWRDRWAKGGVDDALRVAIITGVSARNPAHYAVTVGPNLTQFEQSHAKTFVAVSRINRMEPMTSHNLERFLAAYRRYGGFFLVSAQAGSPPTPDYNLCLFRRQLDIRPAWQITENDLDMMVLQEDDDPIVPATVSDPPVKNALERIRTLRQRRHSDA